MKKGTQQLEGWPEHQALTHETVAGKMFQARNPTTSFLTAATLIYAIGAGITAAAGHSSTGLCIHKHFLLQHRPFD